MEILQTKSQQELLQSVLVEVAKATNELRCARGDIDKASSRLSFSLAVLNELLQREGTKD